MDERALGTDLQAYRTFDVPVQGGTLRVAQWGERGPVIVCSHGITATHTEFLFLAKALAGEACLIAPDHRGRGRSNGIQGPWGMAAHAADLAAVMDHLGIERADLLLGHSMGGFVAAVTAAEYPRRVKQVLLVDGGVPLMDVRFLTWMPFSSLLIERLTLKILGPSLTRLDMRFADREAYRRFWRAHPALANDWSPEIEAYIDYDLEGEPPAMRPSTRKDALLLDVRTQLVETLVPRALKALQCPVRFLRAEGGIMNDKPLYDEAKLAREGRKIARFSHATIARVNHFTILMSARGAAAVAAEVRTLVA